MEKTSIIILNYNGGKELLDCVESVYRTKKCEFEVILVDNASKDNSHKIVKEKFSQIRLFKNKKNIGMAARNIGIQNAVGKFIVFLDSDTIVSENWLNQFIECYLEKGEGLYQPKLLEKNDEKKINSAGNMINVFGFGFSRGKGEIDQNGFQTGKISYTSGACTFSSSEVIRKIGEIDPIFFAYHDDLDYGWRAKLLDIPSFYESEIIVKHLGSPTLKWTKQKFFLLERNRWICILSLYSSKSFLKLLPSLIIIEVGLLIFFITKGLFFTKIKTAFSLIKFSKKILERKKKFQKSRKISDKEIIEVFTNEFLIPGNIIDSKIGNFSNKIIVSLSQIARKSLN